MKKLPRLLTLIVVLAIIISGGIYKYSHRIRYNDSFVNGNSYGNLYNAGLFCESNGTIFFANPKDNNRLYSMNTTGGNVKKLCNDTVMYINADSNYIYFVRNNTGNSENYSFFSYNKNSLCRMPRDGGKTTILDPKPCIYATLIGNYIYYLHYDTETATTLYKIGIDGKDKKQLTKSYIFNCNAVGQYFYFNSPEDGRLYKFDTVTDTKSLVLDCNCYKPIVTDSNNVYYMDVSQNNKLVHNNISSNKPIALSKDPVDVFNVYGSYVYYQREGKNPALCVIKNDGSGYKEIAKGTYTTINVTSYYIYFADYNTGDIFYTSASNPGDIMSFNPDVIK